MRPPRFWYAPAGPLALLLQPLGFMHTEPPAGSAGPQSIKHVFL